MQDDFSLTTVRTAGSPLHELLGGRLEAPGNNIATTWTCSSTTWPASPRLPLDSIAWMGGQSEPTMSSTTTGSAGASGHLLFVLTLVIPSSGL
jgi:hypothetical protein